MSNKNNGRIVDVLENDDPNAEAWLFHPYCYENIKPGHSAYLFTNEDDFTPEETALRPDEVELYRCTGCNQLIS